jgi:hypothetical protein
MLSRRDYNKPARRARGGREVPDAYNRRIKFRAISRFPVRFYAFLLLVCLVFCAPAVRSQAAESSDPQFKAHKSYDEVKRDNERMKAMNKDRAKRIQRDTDKLLQLATELKQYVDKTNENVMSVDVIRKAEQVEKLAKNIREKMKEDYRIPDTTGIQP